MDVVGGIRVIEAIFDVVSEYVVVRFPAVVAFIVVTGSVVVFVE